MIRVLGSQLDESLFEIENVDRFLRHGHVLGRRQRENRRISPSLLAARSSRVVDQDPAHGLRRHGEEVCTVLPLHARLVDESDPGLVHQCRTLQRVIAALGREAPSRERSQLVVELGEQLVVRGGIARVESVQDFGQIIMRHERLRGENSSLGHHDAHVTRSQGP